MNDRNDIRVLSLTTLTEIGEEKATGRREAKAETNRGRETGCRAGMKNWWEFVVTS